MGLSFVLITSIYGFGLLFHLGLGYLALSLLWVVLLEVDIRGSRERFRSSHIRVALDVTALTLFVHITNNAASFLVMGYVVVIALSSVREDSGLGRGAVVYSSLAYGLLIVLTGLGVLEPASILGPATRPGLLSIVSAPLLLAGFCFLVNRVVHTLYGRSVESLHAAELDRERAEMTTVIAEKLRWELEAYADFARRLNSATDLDELTERVFRFLVEGFHARNSVLYLADEGDSRLRLRASSLPPASVRPAERASEPSQSAVAPAPPETVLRSSLLAVARAIGSRTPVFSSLSDAQEGDRTLMESVGAATLHAVPLLIHDEAFAVLEILDAPGVARDEGDLRSLHSFCEQISGSLRSAMLRDEADELRRNAEKARQEAERSQQELASLSDFARQINSERNLDIILNRIFLFIESYYDLDGIWLQFIDEEDRELYTYKTTRPPSLTDEQVNYIRGMRVSLDMEGGISKLVYERKRLFYMARRPRHMSEVDSHIASFLGIDSCLYVPLIIHDQTKALISFTRFDRPMRLSRKDIAGIKWFCDQIAGAINNSRLHTESEFSRMIAEQRLDEVRRLKFQQDTDYYLTSNLIRPLEKIRVESETVSVSSFTRQKKSFPHLRWHCEIGGDLTQAASVMLKGRRHTAFLNADAMGKSIQGAGGVLVLGSVFMIIVDRTPKTRYQYPEQWLKNTYVELDKIFRTFEGSMYISLVMGLVDDATGALYFVNAEHPYPVLYRSGQARFVNPRYRARKLGFLLGHDKLAVDFLRLQDGDQLICGSDGRDDILLPSRNAQGNEMNSDDALFLEHVNKAKGDLEGTYDAIRATGSITDDFSLLSIAYARAETAVTCSIAPDVALDIAGEAQELIRNARAAEAAALLQEPCRAVLESGGTGDESDLCYCLVVTALMHAYIVLGRFQEGRDLAEEYILINPQSTRLIHQLAICVHRMGDLEYAADCGERVLLRNPEDEDGLAHLAEIYVALENPQRADWLLRELLLINPAHPAVADLPVSPSGSGEERKPA